ncbi:MAG TPA: serine/threonine-protein kinase [Kofleriaceae bacterium]|nr:serine/threonine-protein kinase [Kofleriaceae bacterium]
MSDAFEEFGPYLVYERLGQGGMATVHRAEKRGVGIRRPIALKRLLFHVAADPALVKLFVDEARLASHLRHANVAQTYELGKVGDTFFIAMEYASGPTLAQIIRQCLAAAGDMPLTITVNVLAQICEALDHAHNLCDETGRSLRIIHRDVSPANIIVTNTGVVKLIDFGIAKATISSVQTQAGFIKGKFGYIAPEYITGQIDARVDLFAVGVVAHEMMSGRRLFEGKDDFETLQNIRDMNLLPPSRWNPHVPPDLDDIVMTALQRDPARRWQSAGAMQVALTHVAREFGRVVGGQQVAEWIDWAFSQLPPDSGRLTDADAGDSAATVARIPDPDSSLSIEVSRISASALDGAPPPRALRPEPSPQPVPRREPSPPPQLRALRPEPALRAHRPRLPSESDETMPLERIELSRGDIELLTPSPELAPPPPMLPPPAPVPPPPTPRSTRTQGVASPPPPPIAPPRPSLLRDASPAPALPRPSLRELQALGPPPSVSSSRELDVLARPPPRSTRPVPPPPGEMPEPPSLEPAPSARRGAKPRPGSTQKTRPQPRPTARAAAAHGLPAALPIVLPIAPARARRGLLWLIALMLALGAAAMAAAYYWPDL